MKIVIKNGTIITMNKKDEIINADVIINDDKIVDIVKNYDGDYDKLIDATKKIVMPGLINCHTHMGMSIFKGTNDGLSLMDWLNKKIWPIENNMTINDVMVSNKLSAIEAIKTGTTTVNDMYFYESTLKAITDTGLRTSFSITLIDSHKEGFSDLEKLLSEKHPDTVSLTIAPHSLYTCSKPLLYKAYLYSTKYNLPIHMHFCENENEINTVKEKYKKEPVEVLNDLGFLERKLILAHGVTGVNPKKLNENTSIVLNPASNMNLGCGIAPIKEYLDNNINLAIGTDGDGSGLSLDMFNSLQLTSFMYKTLYKDPSFSSYEVLKMGTINGAKALGLEEKIGSIEKGKQADIIILDLNTTTFKPINNLINQVVHNVKPENVLHSIINGKIVMLNRKLNFIDEEETLKEVNEIIDRLKMKEE